MVALPKIPEEWSGRGGLLAFDQDAPFETGSGPDQRDEMGRAGAPAHRFRP